MELQDLHITLQPAQGFFQNQRIIGIDLSSRVNLEAFEISDEFYFDHGALSSVNLDPHKTGNILLYLKNERVLESISDEISIDYTARSLNDSDELRGKIIFDGLDFGIQANPIDISLDYCCDLPDRLTIDIRDYNFGKPVSLTSVGDNIVNAGTINLSDIDTSDYNDDYNNDYGSVPNKLITYELDHQSGFWNTLGATDRFKYTMEYKGKIAESFISINRVNKKQ